MASLYPLIPAPWEIPVDFKITKSLLPFAPRHLTIYDSTGSLAYRVIHGGSSSTSPRRRVMTLFDASGSTLVTVVYEHAEWKAYRGIVNQSNDVMFTAKSLSDSRFRTVIDVFLPERNLEDSKPSFRLTGNPFGRYCTISKEDTIVAQVQLTDIPILVEIFATSILPNFYGSIYTLICCINGRREFIQGGNFH